jgi:hypothetical protein
VTLGVDSSYWAFRRSTIEGQTRPQSSASSFVLSKLTEKWKKRHRSQSHRAECGKRQKPHVGFAHALSPLSQPALFTCSWNLAEHARDSRLLQDKSWILGKFILFSFNCFTKYFQKYLNCDRSNELSDLLLYLNAK